VRRLALWWGNLLPEHRTWWARWWMYPRWMVGPRMVGVGSTWEYEVYFWASHQIARMIPGRCTSCPGRNYTHKMGCARLRGVPGRRNWSQGG
jgi:hypothetical protein